VGARRRHLKLERIGPERFILVDDRMLDWIAARIPGVNPDNWRGFARAVGVAVKGEIVAGMAVGGWERGNIEISFAADNARWATRDTIKRLMAWPFVQLDCHRVTCRCAASNERAIRFCRGIGFKDEGLMKLGWSPTEDCVLLGLLRSEAPEWMIERPHDTLAATLEIA
jgi:RimJ/RimL family protein N-acetyltransferase